MRTTADFKRPAALGEPSAFGKLSQPPILGTMAAVAAASAELLIIGWYIFRVLLQVSVPGVPGGRGVPMCVP